MGLGLAANWLFSLIFAVLSLRGARSSEETEESEAVQWRSCPEPSVSELPPCPAKGCLLCPDNAIRHPDCQCRAGYNLRDFRKPAHTTSTTMSFGNVTSTTPTTTTTSQTTASSEWAWHPDCVVNPDFPQIGWDGELGWLGQCEPKFCASPSPPGRSTAVQTQDGFEILRFLDRTYFLCEEGYRIEAFVSDASKSFVAISLVDTSGADKFLFRHHADRQCKAVQADSNDILPDLNQSACEAECVANATCVAFETSCEGQCKIILKCAEEVVSGCGAHLFKKLTLPKDRLVEFECGPEGTCVNVTSSRCTPLCGDGLLVSSSHLPKNETWEECDDGNVFHNDGCDEYCRVEPGIVCVGGSPSGADQCMVATSTASSSITLEILGSRVPDSGEILAASRVAIASVIGCLPRDVEVSMAEEPGDDAGQGTDSNDSGQIGSTEVGVIEAASTAYASTAYSVNMTVQVHFSVKVVDASPVSMFRIAGQLRLPGAFVAALMVAYVDHTTLSDLFVRATRLEEPIIIGKPPVSESASLFLLSAVVGALSTPAIILAVWYMFPCLVTPIYVYSRRIFPRVLRMSAAKTECEDDEFRNEWRYKLGDWLDAKVLCLSLVICAPARMADTWDAMRFMPFWRGFLQAMWCFTLYLCGCGICAVRGAARMRWKIRKHFNITEQGDFLQWHDYVSWLFCPICCIIQEARHVDGALENMVVEEEDDVVIVDVRDTVPIAPIHEEVEAESESSFEAIEPDD